MISIKKTYFWEYNQIAGIYSEAFSKEYKECWTIKKAKNKLKLFSKYCDIYSIFYDKTIVGVMVINPNQFLPGTVVCLEEIAIKKEFRNKGIGKFCLKWIEKEYSKRGFKLIMFLSLKDSKAFGFYKKQKYKLSKNQFIYEKELK